MPPPLQHVHNQHLYFDLLTLKVVSESRVTWATSVPILVFLGLSVLDLSPMYVTDRRQTSDMHHRLMPLPQGRGHNNQNSRLKISQAHVKNSQIPGKENENYADHVGKLCKGKHVHNQHLYYRSFIPLYVRAESTDHRPIASCPMFAPCGISWVNISTKFRD